MSEPTPDPASLALRLAQVPPGSVGAGLALQAGDVLLAVNGNPFLGPATALAERLAQRRGAALALTFRRGTKDLTVLSRRVDLGLWDQVAPPLDLAEGNRLDPDLMSNWEVLRSPAGLFDIYRPQPSPFAASLPLLWLLYQRLWIAAATLLAAMTVSAAVSPLAVLGIWVVAGWHLWRHGTYHLRADRAFRGLWRHSVHAARSEAQARAAHLRFYPNDQPLFAPPRRAVEAEAAG